MFVSQATVYMKKTPQEQQLVLHQSQKTSVLYGIKLEGWTGPDCQGGLGARKKRYLFPELLKSETFAPRRGFAEGHISGPFVRFFFKRISKVKWQRWLSLERICIQSIPACPSSCQATTLQSSASRNIRTKPHWSSITKRKHPGPNFCTR